MLMRWGQKLQKKKDSKKFPPYEKWPKEWELPLVCELLLYNAVYSTNKVNVTSVYWNL